MAVGTTSSLALAQSTTGGYTSIVQRIAERFGVSEDEVQQVFDEVHADHRTQKQENFTASLDESVASGDLTDTQAQLILDKKEDMIAFHESLKDMSPEEKQEAFQNHKEELKQWAEENDINTNELFGGHGMNGFRNKGFHTGFGFGFK